MPDNKINRKMTIRQNESEKDYLLIKRPSEREQTLVREYSLATPNRVEYSSGSYIY